MFYLDEGMHSMACHSDIIILVFKPHFLCPSQYCLSRRRISVDDSGKKIGSRFHQVLSTVTVIHSVVVRFAAFMPLEEGKTNGRIITNMRHGKATSSRSLLLTLAQTQALVGHSTSSEFSLR